MSLNGLNTNAYPLTLDGTQSLDVSSLTIGGQPVDLSNLVPYTGATTTLDMGSQNIRTTHVPTTNPDVVNKLALDTSINNLVVSIAGSFLDKVTATPQSVVGNVTYTAQLTADNLVVPATKVANLGTVVEVGPNYRQTLVTDASVTVGQYFGTITSSLGVYQASSSQDMGTVILGSTLTVGQRYRVQINVLGSNPSDTVVALYQSSNGTALNSLLQTESFSGGSTIFKVINQTFTASQPYAILCLFTTGGGATLKWFGLERYEVGVELEKVTLPLLTASKVPILNSAKQLVASGTDAVKLDYLDNVSSDIQTQLNGKLNLSGSNANQNIVIGSYKVQSTATPTVSSDYTTKQYVDSEISGAGSLYLLKTGGTMTGDIIMGANKITSTATPTTDDTLTRKGYVDTQLALKAGLADTQTFSGVNTFSNTVNLSALTASRVLQLDASKNIQTSTVTTTELGYVSGVTSGIQAQINALVAVQGNYVLKAGDTMTGALLMGGNKITTSYTPVNAEDLTRKGYVDTQLALKAGLASTQTFTGVNTFSNTINLSNLTADRVLFLDGSKNVSVGNVTSTELNYLSGVTSGIQSQLNARVLKAGDTMTGTLRFDKSTVGAPTAGANGGNGTRIILYPGDATLVGYELGIQADTFWSSVPTGKRFVWYEQTTERMRLNGDVLSVGNISMPINGEINWGPSKYSRIVDDFQLRICSDDEISFNMGANSTTLGTPQMTITPTGVGIGTTTPQKLLDLSQKDWNCVVGTPVYASALIGASYGTGGVSAGTAGILLEGGTNYGQSTSMAFSRLLNGVRTEIMRLGEFSGAYNVGIGTTNPSYKLDVVGNIRAYGNGPGGPAYFTCENAATGDAYAIYACRSNGGASVWFQNSSTRTGDGGANCATFRNDAGALRLQSAGGNGIYITSTTGTIGIGTDAPETNWAGSAIPNAKVTILGGVPLATGGKARISLGADSRHFSAIEAEHIGSGSTTLSFWTTESAFVNSSNPYRRMFINSVGNVGINTDSPSKRLEVWGESGFIGQINSSISGVNANITPNLKFANTASHIDNNAGEVWLFTAFNGHMSIGRNANRDATTANLVLGASSTEEAQIISTKSNNTGYMPMSFGGSKYTFVGGPVNIAGASPYAVPTGLTTAAGSLVIGGNQNYVGGWNAGFLMECMDTTEINVHDYGARLASFMYYNNNLFTIGRDTGWGTSNANFAGFVGIGTATPLGPLDVNVGGAFGFDRFIVKTTSFWGDGCSTRSETAGTQYGTLSRFMFLQPHIVSESDGWCSMRMGRSGGVATGRWWEVAVRADASFQIGVERSSQFVINTNGNVGIGTTAPGGLLELNSTTAAYNSSLIIKANGGAGVMLDSSGTAGGAKYALLSSITGYGIGAGGFGIYSESGGAYRFSIVGNGRINLGPFTAHTRVGINGGNLGGNVLNPADWPADANGILISDGQQGPNTAGLYVGHQLGNGYITALQPNVAWNPLYISSAITYMYWYGLLCAYTWAGGWVQVSDEREKEDIQPLKTDKSLQRVLALKPYHYRRKFPENEKTPVPDEVKQMRQIGFLAQEVKESNPHCVSEWCNKECKDDEDGGKRLGLSYNDYIVHLVGAVQEVVKRLDALTESNQEQQKQIDVLTERNKVLEAWAREAEKREKKMEQDILKLASLVQQLIPK